MFIFNNVRCPFPPSCSFIDARYVQVTSLPLLLISALAAAGSLDGLLGPGDVLADVIQRGRVYILINALVGNLMRFALGPCTFHPRWPLISTDSDSPDLMQTHTQAFHLDPRSDDPLHGTIPKPVVSGPSIGQKLVRSVKWLGQALNPPLIGGLAAMFFGVIPFTQDQLFTSSGWLSP